MKRLLLVLCMGALFTTVNAQKVIGEITMQDGSKISVHDGENNEKAKSGKDKHKPYFQMRKKGSRTIGRVYTLNLQIFYFDADGVIQKKNIDEIREVNLDVQALDEFRILGFSAVNGASRFHFDIRDSGVKEIVLRTLRVKKKSPRLVEIVAENENYFLTTRLMGDFQLFTIFDKDENVVENQIMHSLSRGKSEKAFEKIKKYFGSCSELISKMEANLQNTAKMGNGPLKRKVVYNLMTVSPENGSATNYLTNIKCN